MSGFVPVCTVDVQDTTGAGDAFTCGFLAYMLAEVREGRVREDERSKGVCHHHSWSGQTLPNSKYVNPLTPQDTPSLDEMCSNAKEIQEAVRFGAACGALTTTGSGAIGAQPQMDRILALLESERQKSAAQAA